MWNRNIPWRKSAFHYHSSIQSHYWFSHSGSRIILFNLTKRQNFSSPSQGHPWGQINHIWMRNVTVIESETWWEWLALSSFKLNLCLFFRWFHDEENRIYAIKFGWVNKLIHPWQVFVPALFNWCFSDVSPTQVTCSFRVCHFCLWRPAIPNSRNGQTFSFRSKEHPVYVQHSLIVVKSVNLVSQKCSVPWA